MEGYMWDEDTGKPVKANDDMMENLGRLALLGTEYTEMRKKRERTKPTNWAVI
jgi:hypothetical protein